MPLQFLITLGYQTTEGAVLRHFDWESKRIVRDLEYRSPTASFLERLRAEGVTLPENITPKCKFNGGMARGDHFYTCVFNEVIRIHLGNWAVDQVFTDRCFNDLHHAHVNDSGIYLSNSGLDTVEQFDHEGRHVRRYPVRLEPPESWISPDIDYRFVPQTKHEAHPNEVIPWNGTLLVNVPVRREVARLDDLTPMVTGFPQMMHDGILRDGYYYWTTVDGKIVRASAETLQLEPVADLREFHGPGEPGWCRGLEIVGDLAFVGFTQFRKPSKREFLSYAIRGGKIHASHIVCYDLKRQRLVEMYYFPRPDMVVHGIYTYLPSA